MAFSKGDYGVLNRILRREIRC